MLPSSASIVVAERLAHLPAHAGARKTKTAAPVGFSCSFGRLGQVLDLLGFVPTSRAGA